jgi:hypothetical protein
MKFISIKKLKNILIELCNQYDNEIEELEEFSTDWWDEEHNYCETEINGKITAVIEMADLLKIKIFRVLQKKRKVNAHE